MDTIFKAMALFCNTWHVYKTNTLCTVTTKQCQDASVASQGERSEFVVSADMEVSTPRCFLRDYELSTLCGSIAAISTPVVC